MTAVALINGKPAAWVSVQLAEKVGLPKFSNVDIGPIVIGKWVEDTPEARRAAMDEITAECEDVMMNERGKVLQFLKDQGIIEAS